MKRSICLLLSLLLCASLLLLPAGAAVRGDIDGDGNLTAADARLALRRSVGLESYLPGSGKFLAADSDGNGVVNAADARHLLRGAVGLPDETGVQTPETEAVTAGFSLSQMRFALSLLKQETAKGGNNVLLSPLSASYALAMTANGAAGDTQRELLAALGAKDADTLNRQLYSLAAALPQEESCSLSVANSLWIATRAQPFVQAPFLRTNLSYYGAGVNVCDFNNDSLAMINGWVKEKTNGMIDKILDYADPATAVLLLNALCMEADWAKPFEERLVFDGKFTKTDGQKVPVKMMAGAESVYLENDAAIGFVKPYVNGSLRFAAILPKAETDVNAFLADLDAETLSALLANAVMEDVEVQMPKFSYDYEASLKDSLSAMGVQSLFDPGRADLSAMLASPMTTYADDVLQKTFIEVNTQGTRAAAVTAVIVKNASFVITDKEVVLDRPFFFVITAGEANVPVFIGVVNNPA